MEGRRSGRQTARPPRGIRRPERPHPDRAATPRPSPTVEGKEARLAPARCSRCSPRRRPVRRRDPRSGSPGRRRRARRRAGSGSASAGRSVGTPRCGAARWPCHRCSRPTPRQAWTSRRGRAPRTRPLPPHDGARAPQRAPAPDHPRVRRASMWCSRSRPQPDPRPATPSRSASSASWRARSLSPRMRLLSDAADSTAHAARATCPPRDGKRVFGPDPMPLTVVAVGVRCERGDDAQGEARRRRCRRGRAPRSPRRGGCRARVHSERATRARRGPAARRPAASANGGVVLGVAAAQRSASPSRRGARGRTGRSVSSSW